MNLLADESVDRQIVERLRQDGHQVSSIAETGPGITDLMVLERANEASALLLTADKDFGELVFQEGRLNSGGVVLIRLAGLSGTRKAEITSNAFRERGRDFPNCFSVISAGKIRIRPRV
jgi:predicted nuclease of predicted toxin-antitoxin system